MKLVKVVFVGFGRLGLRIGKRGWFNLFRSGVAVIEFLYNCIRIYIISIDNTIQYPYNINFGSLGKARLTPHTL